MGWGGNNVPPSLNRLRVKRGFSSAVGTGLARLGIFLENF